MGARLKGHEKSAYEAEIFPWAESVLSRLNRIEFRLSQELDNSGSSGGGGDSMMAITFPAEEQKPIPYSSSRGEAGWPWRAGSGIYQSQMPKKKAATAEAMDKRAAAFCRNEKKKVDRSRRYKRWFQIGC